MVTLAERRLRRGPDGPTACGFWAALDVWTRRPQVANRRLSGCRLEAERETRCSEAGLRPLLEELVPGWRDEPGREVDGILLAVTGERASGRLKVTLRTVIPKTQAESCREVVIQDFENNTATFIPLERHNSEMYTCKKNNIYSFKLRQDKGDELFWFISVSILCPEKWNADGIVYPKPAWLSDVLLTKIVKWSSENKKNNFKSTLSLISVEKYSECYHRLKAKYKDMVKTYVDFEVQEQTVPSFLALCNVLIRSDENTKIWPEVTNPEKFVYEDVAIATYLLVLWEAERLEKGLTAKQSFIDLGCGNGLLVHILTNEGHPGRGIDVRKRKIWDMYGPQTCLEECAITPSDDFLFPDVDWIIGNHSDELTPWIPVVAARSSYSCRYFVLPCCFFDFYGKYCRKQTKSTQYRAYLDFIIEVGSACGFKVEEDCLRIPSTKRVCLIGNQRTYSSSCEKRLDEERTQYIRERCSYTLCAGDDTGFSKIKDCASPFPHVTDCSVVEDDMMQDSSADTDCPVPNKWGTGFQPREKVEKIRNCAALPRDFVDNVVLQVAKALLKVNQDNYDRHDEDSAKYWHKGGWNCFEMATNSILQDRIKDNCIAERISVEEVFEVFLLAGSLSLKNVADLLDCDTLQKLKKECGGLQTLLRNNCQVFEVAHGNVQIRDWSKEKQDKQKEKHTKNLSPDEKRKLLSEACKTRLCWFFVNHPDGCPRIAEKCPFAHGIKELRSRANSRK